jgi:hypothetical protein
MGSGDEDTRAALPREGAHRLLQFFTYEHLPPRLQAASKPIGDLARQLDSMLPDGPEKTTGMRKLLEAKDCFVRTLLEK